VGKCFKRVPSFKDKSVVDPYVVHWKQVSGRMWENKYRMSIPSRETNYLGSSKYEREQPVLNEHTWALSGQWMRHRFFEALSDSVIVRQDVAIAEMDKSKSNGYPHNLKYRQKRDYIATADFAINDNEYYEFLASPENYIPCFWGLADKYELRSVEKLAVGKIRAFTASSIHHTVANARMCYDFNQKFYASNMKTPSFVGATKYFGVWNEMVRRLEVHPNGFELDMKDYDASMFRRALADMAEMRFEFLAPEHRTIESYYRLRNLYDDVINSVMVTPLGEVIVKDTGNPSGQGNTIVDNTIILYRLFCYAFIELHKQHYVGDAERIREIIEIRSRHNAVVDSDVDEDALDEELQRLYARRLTQDYMNKNVCAFLNGDDNSFTCTDTVVSWFNARSIAMSLGTIGVTVTTPCEEPRSAHELGFLSQTSRLDEISNKYLPVPEHERIMDSLELASESADIRWSLLRAYALRIESWACEKTRALIWSYIQFVWKTYPQELSGACLVPKTGVPMKYDDIAKSLMTDDELRRLYTGMELNGDTTKSEWSLRLACVSEHVKLVSTDAYCTINSFRTHY
jgi:hypothetical protein